MEWKIEYWKRDGFSFGISASPKRDSALFLPGSHLFYPRLLSEAKILEKYQVIVMDHRGFAHLQRTKDSVEDYELSWVISDFTEYIAHSIPNEVPIHLFGHSGHGYMALLLAHAQPKRFSSLSLVGTGPNHGAPLFAREPYFEQLATKERKERNLANQLRFEADCKESPEHFFIHYCRKEEALAFFDWKTDSSHFWSGIKTNRLAFDHLFGKEFANIDSKALLSELQIPAALFLGRYDFQVAPHFTWDPVCIQNPRLKKFVFEKSAHYPFWEEPEEFWMRYENWLERESLLSL